jgi:integrase
VIASERVNGTTKSGRARVVSIDEETVTVLRQRKADQAAEQLKAADSWRGTKDGYVSRLDGASRSTPIPSRR